MIARLRGTTPRPAEGGGEAAAITPGAEQAARPDRALVVRLGGLGAVVALSAVLNTVRLSQNGYANIFYSAGVRSMLGSWHNFFFVSFDPEGLVTMDKPPLALWVQATSAKIFGFSPLSLLLPEALMAVAAVAVLYLVLAKRWGTGAAIAGGAAMAVFPSFVAVSRANGVDTLLLLLLVLACWAGIAACESGRWRSLIAAGVLVGLAFNTKTLAAYLAVPGIAFAYFVCGPGSLRRRILQLLAAGTAMAIVSFAWIAAVEATPASKRPYIGSSTNNTELGLTFEYNGFGRVGGQTGGPGQTHGKPGARVPLHTEERFDARLEREHHVKPPPAPKFPRSPNHGREPNPVPFGGAPGPFRLFGKGLGDQGGWFLPFAFVGLLAALALCWLDSRRGAADEGPPGEAGGRRGSAADIGARGEAEGRRGAAADDEPGARGRAEGLALDRPRGRRDPRLASTIVLGGWLATEAVVLSGSKGIVHPYYMSALAPGAGAMTGIGAAALWRLCTGRAPVWGLALGGLAVVATVTCEVVLMHRHDYMRWFVPLLAAGAAVGLAALLGAALMRRAAVAAGALAAIVALLLVVPTGYASSTWLAPVEATFPAAGPKANAGQGGLGLSARSIAIDRAIAAYVRTHGPSSRYELLTVAADTASPFIFFGMKASALAGYSGVDQVLTGPQLARLVRRREARYVLLGGQYSTRGGNGATRAVLRACHEFAPFQWNAPVPYAFGLVLFDCAGHEAALAAS